MQTESSIPGSKIIQLLLQKDILRSGVGEDQVNLRCVTAAPAANDRTNDLHHGRNACSPSNHAESSDHVWAVNKRALGPLYLDWLTGSEGSDMLGDIALRICLDEEIEMSALVVVGDWRVGSDNFLGTTVWLWDICSNGYVLSDREPQRDLRGRQLEPVTR